MSGLMPGPPEATDWSHAVAPLRGFLPGPDRSLAPSSAGTTAVQSGGTAGTVYPVAVPEPFGRSARRRSPGQQCELCSEPVSTGHAHVVDLEARSLACTCRACALLFAHGTAPGSRFRAIPDRFRYVPAFRMDQTQWDRIQIPVDVAFLFQNSALGQFAAFYPSPGGATESLLDLAAWSDVLAANPEVAEPVPDVEALLLRRSPGGFECFLVPIDACYELVGLVRLHWTGFAGGAEVWAALDEFFERVRSRSDVVGAGRA